MPSITKLPTGEVILNVDHSVGRYGRNRMVDVQLVQLLLNLLIETTKHTGPISDPPLPAPEPLKPDGICGPKDSHNNNCFTFLDSISQRWAMCPDIRFN